MAMKYIVAEQLGREVIFVFDAGIMHAHFARDQRIPRDRIRGAGFIGRRGDNPLCCQGVSESLGIQSRGAADERILRQGLDPADAA